MCKQVEIVDLPDKQKQEERERRNAEFDKELDGALHAFENGIIDETLIKLKVGVDALDKEQDEPLTKSDFQTILDHVTQERKILIENLEKRKQDTE